MFAALDLGTNNCRLLIATPSSKGFRIVDAFSRIVRLGEGVDESGRLSEAAMDRALERPGRVRRKDRPARRHAHPRGGDPGLPRRRQRRRLSRKGCPDHGAAAQPDLAARGGSARGRRLPRSAGSRGQGRPGAGRRRRIDGAVLGRPDRARPRRRSPPPSLLAIADPGDGVDPAGRGHLGRAVSGEDRLRRSRPPAGHGRRHEGNGSRRFSTPRCSGRCSRPARRTWWEPRARSPALPACT